MHYNNSYILCRVYIYHSQHNFHIYYKLYTFHICLCNSRTCHNPYNFCNHYNAYSQYNYRNANNLCMLNNHHTLMKRSSIYNDCSYMYYNNMYIQHRLNSIYYHSYYHYNRSNTYYQCYQTSK